jgi:hypothetical protein
MSWWVAQHLLLLLTSPSQATVAASQHSCLVPNPRLRPLFGTLLLAVVVAVQGPCACLVGSAWGLQQQERAAAHLTSSL